jgi:hypothetical protein
MKKNMKVFTTAILAASFGLSGTAFALDVDFGAAGAAANPTTEIEKMLKYTLEDEYLAKAEYETIIAEYGSVRPFSNIVKAEATHIAALEPLFEAYKLELPTVDASKYTVVPETLEESYKAGVDAEVKNIAMYEEFLKLDLPDDIEFVFENLMKASESHLAAFERAADGQTGTGIGQGGVNRGGRGSRGNGVQTNQQLNDGTGFQGARRGNAANTERGQRNLNLNNGICILDEE